MKKAWIWCLVLVLVSAAGLAHADPYETEYGVRFGMTVSEVLGIEKEQGGVLSSTYQAPYAYEMSFEKNVTLYSRECMRMEYDFTPKDRLLFQVYYVLTGGADDYEYLKEKLAAEYGAPESDGCASVLYKQRGASHTEVAHWEPAGEGGAAVDLWYNDYGTVFIAFYTADPAGSAAGSGTYTDDTGISFPYPDGWHITLGIESLPYAMIGFNPDGDNRSALTYYQQDLWEFYRDTFVNFGMTRADLNNDFLDPDLVGAIMTPIVPENLRTRDAGSVRYWMFDYESGGNSFTIAMTVQGGYCHMFSLMSPDRLEELQPELERFLETVTFAP